MTQLTPAQAFGKRLRRERWLLCAEKDREIEYQEVAEAAGVEPSTAGRWFDGATIPRDDALAKLAEFFGVTQAYLRFGQEPRRGAAAPIEIERDYEGSEPGTAKRDAERKSPAKKAAGWRGKR